MWPADFPTGSHTEDGKWTKKRVILPASPQTSKYPTSPSRWSVSQGSYQGEDHLENPLANPGPASSPRRELRFGMFKIRSFSSQCFYSSWQSQPGHFYGSISVRQTAKMPFISLGCSVSPTLSFFPSTGRRSLGNFSPWQRQCSKW